MLGAGRDRGISPEMPPSASTFLSLTISVTGVVRLSESAGLAPPFPSDVYPIFLNVGFVGQRRPIWCLITGVPTPARHLPSNDDIS